MDHPIRLYRIEDIEHRLTIQNIFLKEMVIGHIDMIPIPETQIIDHKDLMSSLLKVLNDGGPDESRSTGY